MRKRALVFANGVFKRHEKVKAIHRKGDLVICSDGGVLHALDAGLEPDMVVGDLDSLPKEVLESLEARDVKIVRYPEKKDKTDLELALEAAVRAGAVEIVIFALSGGRIDQFLGNILLLAREDWNGLAITVVEEEQTAWLLRGPGTLTVVGSSGDLFSIVPLSSVEGVRTKGAEWELTGECFEPGTTRPLSNVLLTDEVTVSIERGTCLIVHTEA